MRCLRLIVSGMLSVWLGVTIVFFALRLLPGDALQAQLSMSGASQDVVEMRRAAQGLNEPVVSQYIRYLTELLRGNMGRSLSSGETVADALARSLPYTSNLAVGAGTVAAGLGIGLGVAGAHNNRVISTGARGLISLSLSVPIYWSGIIVIYLVSVRLALLPAVGGGSAAHLILPISVLGFHTAGAIARITLASVRSAAQAEFTLTARAKGLNEWHVMTRHILPVGLLPVVSTLALQIGFLLGGTVVTESMFVRPGIGRLLLDAVIKQDYPVVQGVVLFSAVAYVLVNTVTNLLYDYLDPRVSQ